MSTSSQSVSDRARGLVDQVDAAPQETLDEALALLGHPDGNDPEVASILRRVQGTSLRLLGDLAGAEKALQQAVEAARLAQASVALGEALMSLGVVEAFTGRMDEALLTFDEAEQHLDGVEAARVVFQRSSILYRRGDYEEALELMDRALPALRTAGDHRHVAHTLSNRGVVLGYRGELVRARQDLEQAQLLYGELGFDSAAAVVVHNLGWVAVRAGELARGLRLFDEAAVELDRLGRPSHELAIDRCEALLAAGCPSEARPIARHAAEELCAAGNLLEGAEAYLMEAYVDLGCGDSALATEAAAAAAELFEAHGRVVWGASAEALRLHARWLEGELDLRSLDHLVDVAELLAARHQASAAHSAFLLAGRVSLEAGDLDRAAHLLDRIAAARSSGPVEVRLQAWLATALLRLASGNRGGAARAALAGADLLTSYQAALGALDARATIGAHATELHEIGLRLASESRRVGRVFSWIERTRAGAIRFPPVYPPDDHELAGDLEALRVAAAAVRETEAAGLPADQARSRQQRLEDRVIERTRRIEGRGLEAAMPLQSLDAVRAKLDGRTLVQFAIVGSDRVAVVVDDAGPRLVDAGRAEDCARELGALHRRLRRLAVRKDPEMSTALLESIRRSVVAIDQAVLGPLDVGGELVVVPSGDLQAVPWGLLARVRSNSVAIAPSASVWFAANSRDQARRHDPSVVVATGPQLVAVDDEVEAVGRIYPDARVLTDDAATTGSVLDALDGADIAHIIAHGSISTENPLFSSLRFADGPLYAYDLQRLHRPPKLVVLSACDVGGSIFLAPGEALGMASVLLAAGSRTVVAGSNLLPDTRETVDVVADIHRRYRGGSTAAAAVAGAHAELADARSLLMTLECLGAG